MAAGRMPIRPALLWHPLFPDFLLMKSCPLPCRPRAQNIVCYAALKLTR